jgi:hypothetical protein
VCRVDKRAAAPRRQRQGGRPCAAYARAVRRAARAVDEVELASGIQTFRPMSTCLRPNCCVTALALGLALDNQAH